MSTADTTQSDASHAVLMHSSDVARYAVAGLQKSDTSEQQVALCTDFQSSKKCITGL